MTHITTVSNEEIDEYMEHIRNYLFCSNLCTLRRAQTPTQLLDHLYIGNKADAENVHFLKTLKITHVINCASTGELWPELDDNASPYSIADGIQYLQLRGHDYVCYQMLTKFSLAKSFIDEAKSAGGKALVHCNMGINRSGTICIAYILVHEKTHLLDAIRQVKMHRPALLVNRGFQRQLIQFASDRDQLRKCSKSKS